MKSAKTELDSIRISSTSIELYLSSTELAGLLKVSDNEVAKLARSGVLLRRASPYDSRAFVYPVWQNITRFVERQRARREAAQLDFLTQKARREKTQAARTELELAIQQRKFVSIDEVVREFRPKCLAIRLALERLLEVGVPEAVVNEVLSILDKAPEPRTSTERRRAPLTRVRFRE